MFITAHKPRIGYLVLWNFKLQSSGDNYYFWKSLRWQLFCKEPKGSMFCDYITYHPTKCLGDNNSQDIPGCVDPRTTTPILTFWRSDSTHLTEIIIISFIHLVKSFNEKIKHCSYYRGNIWTFSKLRFFCFFFLKWLNLEAYLKQ